MEQKAALMIIDISEWELVKQTQEQMLQILRNLMASSSQTIPRPHITLKEFCNAVSIGRTKFDQLVAANKLKIIKKQRKIYVLITEIERYFSDATIR